MRVCPFAWGLSLLPPQTNPNPPLFPTALSLSLLLRQGKEVLVTWPYAYFELAQRDPQPDGSRYEGFFSTQATNLFEMTKGK